MIDLLDEFFSFSLVTFLVLSTIFSLVFITKLSNKIPRSTRRWLMYPLYFGFTYLIVSLTHASIGVVMLAYVPALVAIMFDDFRIAVVVALVKPVITLLFLTLIAPGEIRDLTLSFEISWVTLMILLWIFRRVGHHVWVYYASAFILAILEDELGLLGPSNSELVVVASVVTYLFVVSFMLYLQKHIIADEQAYLAELNTDPLTGLFNLRAFKQDVDNLESEQEYLILIMDVDKFKMLNDTLGHSNGNMILKRAADKVTNLFNQLNEDLMAEMQDKYDTPVTFSGGLSSNIWNKFDADETFKIADRLLYQAKRLGGNKIAVDEHVLKCEKCNNIGIGVIN